MMASAGLGVGSNSLWDQVEAIATWCEPTWQALGTTALREGIIGLDQTGWPNLDAKSKKKWQMWSVTTPRVVFHTIRDDKSANSFQALVGDYSGYIVCDDFSTHRAAARGSPDIVLVGCWAHIYRRFEEAFPDFPQAEYAMGLIRLLYDIDEHSPPEDLAANRAFWSKLVLDELYRWMTTVNVLTSTKLGKAIKHTLKIKDRLWLFIHDEYVWLDNNPTERSFRGPVVGRRNHHGSKSRSGTKAASILYSIVETAKLNGIDPLDYLRAIVRNAQLAPGVVTMPWDVAAA
jgi:transposase